MATIRTLSDDDIKVLKGLVDQSKKIYRSLRAQPYSTDNDPPASDTYVVLVGGEGIPAATDTIPGVGLCEVYQVVEGSTDKLVAIGLELTVYNLYEVDIPDSVFCLVSKDKAGNWWLTGNPVLPPPQPFTVQITMTQYGYYSWRKVVPKKSSYVIACNLTAGSFVAAYTTPPQFFYTDNPKLLNTVVSGVGINDGTTVLGINVELNEIYLSDQCHYTTNNTNLTFSSNYSASDDGMSGTFAINPVVQANGIPLLVGAYVNVNPSPVIDPVKKQIYVTTDEVEILESSVYLLTPPSSPDGFNVRIPTKDKVTYRVAAGALSVNLLLPAVNQVPIGWSVRFERVDLPLYNPTTFAVINSIIINKVYDGYIQFSTQPIGTVDWQGNTVEFTNCSSGNGYSEWVQTALTYEGVTVFGFGPIVPQATSNGFVIPEHQDGYTLRGMQQVGIQGGYITLDHPDPVTALFTIHAASCGLVNSGQTNSYFSKQDGLLTNQDQQVYGKKTFDQINTNGVLFGNVQTQTGIGTGLTTTTPNTAWTIPLYDGGYHTVGVQIGGRGADGKLGAFDVGAYGGYGGIGSESYARLSADSLTITAPNGNFTVGILNQGGGGSGTPPYATTIDGSDYVAGWLVRVGTGPTDGLPPGDYPQ